jgi:hypothetical protein
MCFDLQFRYLYTFEKGNAFSDEIVREAVMFRIELMTKESVGEGKGRSQIARFEIEGASFAGGLMVSY